MFAWSTIRKLAVSLAVIFVMAYIGMCVLLFVKQRELLYFPTPSVVVIGAEAIVIESDIGDLKGWVVNPGKSNALIYFGGNGEQVERNAEFFSKCLPDQSVYLMPYRGYSGNPGLPSEAGLFADAILLQDFVKSHHADISLMGRSLGSGIAVYVASQQPIQKLLLITPYDSIAKVAAEKYPLFPVSWLVKDRYDSVKYAKRVNATVKILIAEEDVIIPSSHSSLLAKAFSKKPMVKYISGAGHNSISESKEYDAETCGFLR